MKIGLISGEFPPMPGGVGDFTRASWRKPCASRATAFLC